jgi:hypothetical protein
MLWKHMGGWRYSSTLLDLGTDGGEWSASHPGTRWIENWLDRRAGLYPVEKRKISCPCRESNPGRPSRSPSLYWLSSTFLLVVSVTREHSCTCTRLNVVETFNKLNTWSRGLFRILEESSSTLGREVRHHFVVFPYFQAEAWVLLWQRP